ncbi:MAG: hypothetical protein WD851_24605 [Pirellulales bacterium]
MSTILAVKPHLNWLALFYICVWPCAGFTNELSVRPIDYWNVELQWASIPNVDGSLTARTTIVQPQGFERVIESPVEVSAGKARCQLLYPLVDEGRFDVTPGNWNGYWVMGEYQFKSELLDGTTVVHTAEATLDPMSLCQRDNYGPIFSKYPQQFIECSPIRPAYIDDDQMGFTIRTIPDRVATCTAVVDVIARDDEKQLAGPWTMALTGDVVEQSFDSSGWPRGEYWIRIQLEQDGKPVGPYLIRKVWKEILPTKRSVAAPRRIGSEPQLFVSPHGIASAEGIRFVPDELKKEPNGPLVTMDKPWETELLYSKTLHYDTNEKQFVMEYELAGGDRRRDAERAQLPSTICRAVSADGLKWTKPSLGLVNYQGSTDNNLVPPGEEFVPPRDKNLAADLSHDYDQATFRHYDSLKDGPVNMQNVFVTSVKASFANQCPHESSHPFRIGTWPMEKRGNEYLVLTREAILYVGTGMDLYHSTEKITLHVEDKATGTLYYFFRPGAPSYPPHDAPYDNMHMARRCLGVMWSSDGLNWDRRLVVVPDEDDVAGAQFYYNVLYADERELSSARPAMALEDHWNKTAVACDQPAVGSLTVYDAKGNRLWPELVAVDDLLHWRRFDTRQKMIPNGLAGSHDFGLIKVEGEYHQFDNQWWFPYQAINTYHQDYIGLAKMDDIEQFKQTYPNYVEMPGFVDWQQFWERCKSMRYYTGIARCEEGRICHVEPAETEGTLQTLPIVIEGDALVVNAIVPPRGSLQVEVLDEHGKPIPGFDEKACRTVEGDSLAHEVAWKDRQLSELQNNTVHLRFLLNRAQLYGYRLR